MAIDVPCCTFTAVTDQKEHARDPQGPAQARKHTQQTGHSPRTVQKPDTANSAATQLSSRFVLPGTKIATDGATNCRGKGNTPHVSMKDSKVRQGHAHLNQACDPVLVCLPLIARV
jgi:hypothetical protein